MAKDEIRTKKFLVHRTLLQSLHEEWTKRTNSQDILRDCNWTEKVKVAVKQ